MNLSYLQKGTGKDLVMLHGYLASKESFYPQIEYFSRFYRVTALDFPGMGDAEPLREAWSVDDYADWTGDVLDSLQIHGANLLAHSFGGRVAIKLLSRGADFDRSVLTGCAGIVPNRGMGYKIRVKAYRFVRKLAPKYAEKHFGSSEYRLLSPIMRESYKKIVNEDLREDARAISRPVLFVCGERDTATPISSVRVLHECVKNSRLLVMKDCGHFAHLDSPLAFQLAAEEFYNAL